MTTHVKQAIKESITVNQGKVTFSSITASPTVTVISGTANFQNIPFEQIKLIANGETIAWQGSRTSTGLRTTFSIRYDALPKIGRASCTQRDYHLHVVAIAM